jgi:hypothetical protein
MPSDAPLVPSNVRTTVAIDRTIQQRITLHQTLVATQATATGQPRPLILLADGDSWFDYPLSGDLPEASDITVQLGRIVSPAPLILNLAQHGDATTQLLGVSRRNRLLAALTEPKNGPFDAILFCGGGNDLVGDQFRLWLNDAASVGHDVERALNEQALDDILGVVTTAYEDLIATRDQAGLDIPIFVHGYDFALPTNIGVCGLGPWLYPSLQSRGWMQTPSGNDLTTGAAIVKQILLKFRGLMLQLASVGANKVVYVETQGLLQPTDWANELHPVPDGFRKVATPFVGALNSQFDGRADLVTSALPPTVPTGSPTA